MIVTHIYCAESTGIKTPNATIPPTTSTAVKSNNLPTRSLSASLPGLLRAPATPHGVGRPPTTVMTPEQIVEKAKQVKTFIYF